MACPWVERRNGVHAMLDQVNRRRYYRAATGQTPGIHYFASIFTAGVSMLMP
jgi:hypothetical protein